MLGVTIVLTLKYTPSPMRHVTLMGRRDSSVRLNLSYTPEAHFHAHVVAVHPAGPIYWVLALPLQTEPVKKASRMTIITKSSRAVPCLTPRLSKPRDWQLFV